MLILMVHFSLSSAASLFKCHVAFKSTAFKVCAVLHVIDTLRSCYTFISYTILCWLHSMLQSLSGCWIL